MESEIYKYFDAGKGKCEMIDWNITIKEWIKQKLIGGFWVLLSAVLIFSVIWFVANQVGDLDPLVARVFHHIGG